MIEVGRPAIGTSRLLPTTAGDVFSVPMMLLSFGRLIQALVGSMTDLSSMNEEVMARAMKSRTLNAHEH